MKKRLAAFAVLLMLCCLCCVGASAAGDLAIENGVLIKCNGPGGDVVIPDGVTAIGERAFECCTGLTSVSIPDSVTSMGNFVFSCCTSLTRIDVSESSNTYLSLDGILFNKDKTELLVYPAGKSGSSYTIPGSVTRIGSDAFSDCTNLKSIAIPDSVTNIGDRAFSDCDSLTSIAIPGSVTSMGVGVFSRCTSLMKIDVSENNRTYSSMDGVLFNKDKTELLAYPAGKSGSPYTIPENVISIGNWAFRDCTRLESIVLPDSVTSIKDGAFDQCTSLTSITISASVISIGYGAFFSCPNLKEFHVAKENSTYSS